jgi:hypothetical protein
MADELAAFVDPVEQRVAWFALRWADGQSAFSAIVAGRVRP